MDRTVTALLPRGPQTAVLPVPHRTLEHPSFVNGLPAIIAERRPETVCPHCEWLARMIRAGRDVEQYAWTAILHVAAAHPDIDTYRYGGAR